MKNAIKHITTKVGITDSHLDFIKGHIFLLYLNAIKVFYILYR
jgi:hypothetical protein